MHNYAERLEESLDEGSVIVDGAIRGHTTKMVDSIMNTITEDPIKLSLENIQTALPHSIINLVRPGRFIVDSAVARAPKARHPLDNESLGSGPPSKRQRTGAAAPAASTPVPATAISVLGKDWSIEKFFSSPEHDAHVEGLRDNFPEPTDQNSLQTCLKPWQDVGIARLMFLCGSFWRGGILGDPVGMGKSLTALVAALEVRKKRCGKQPGFVLLICRPSLVASWEHEIQTHFRDGLGHAPKTIILDTPLIDARELLAFDIVICSQSFLRTRFLDYDRWETQHMLYHISPEAAEEFSGMPLHHASFLKAPLHTRLFAILGRMISVVVLDESQDVRNIDTQLYKAIRSLKYQYAFMLSGTVMHNGWKDIFGQISLLPGCPLKSFDQFEDAFATRTEEDGLTVTRRDDPRGEKLRLFKKLTSGVILQRPKSLLDLPPLKTSICSIAFPAAYADQLARIKGATNLARWLLLESSNESKSAAFGLITSAQMMAASNLISIGSKVREYLQKKRDEPVEESVLADDDYKPPSEDGNDSDGGLSGTDDEQSITSDSDDDFEPLLDASQTGEMDNVLRADEEDDTPPEKRRRRMDTKFTEEWLGKIQTSTDEDLFSPRVEKILVIIQDIQHDEPDSKIVVVSQFQLFLDVIHEAIRRAHPDICCAEYNGTVSIRERAIIQKNFNIKGGSGPSILLLTATTGGAGLNLQGANHLIITEPLWSPGLNEQVTGRIHRMGQKEETHVYLVTSEESAIDVYMDKARTRKGRFYQEIRTAFDHRDGEAHFD